MIQDIDYHAGSLDAWETFFKTAAPSPVMMARPALKAPGLQMANMGGGMGNAHAGVPMSQSWNVQGAAPLGGGAAGAAPVAQPGTAVASPKAMAAAPAMPAGNVDPTSVRGDVTKASKPPAAPAQTQVGAPAAIQQMPTQIKPQGAAAMAQHASDNAGTVAGGKPMAIPPTPTPAPGAPAPAAQAPMVPPPAPAGTPPPAAAPAPAAPAAPGAPAAGGEAPPTFWNSLKQQAPGALMNTALMAGVPLLMNAFQPSPPPEQR